MTRLQRINLIATWALIALGGAFLAYLAVAGIRAAAAGDAGGLLVNITFGLLAAVGLYRAVRQVRRIQAGDGDGGAQR